MSGEIEGIIQDKKDLRGHTHLNSRKISTISRFFTVTLQQIYIYMHSVHENSDYILIDFKFCMRVFNKIPHLLTKFAFFKSRFPIFLL